MTIKLGLEVIPGTAHAHGGQYCTKMLPQFRVSDAFCEQLKEFGLGSSGIILGNCTLKFVKNTWREAFVNNIICEHAKVLRAFHIVWIVFQPSQQSWPGMSEQLRLIDKWTPAGFALSV